MKSGVKLKLDKKTINKLDNRRGDLTRNEYIAKVLYEHFIDKKRVSFLKDDILGDVNSNEDPENILRAQSIEILINNFQELASDIYDKLDKLDKKINQLQIDNYQKSNIEKIQNYSANKVSTDASGHLENKKIFQFPSEEEGVEFVPSEDDDIDPEGDEVVFYVDESGEYLGDDYTEVEEYNAGSDEFDGEIEYGCPFCNATISEDATYCSNCGNNFDEPYNDSRNAADYAVVEPINNNLNENGRYDPRPEYIKRRDRGNRPTINRFEPNPSSNKSYKGEVVDVKIPHCSNCGNDLAFVEEYKRWYCYDCKKYFGGIPPPKDYSSKPKSYPSPAPNPNPQVKPTIAGSKPSSFIHESDHEKVRPTSQPQMRNPNHQSEVKKKKQRDANWQPLKDYHRYSD